MRKISKSRLHAKKRNTHVASAHSIAKIKQNNYKVLIGLALIVIILIVGVVSVFEVPNYLHDTNKYASYDAEINLTGIEITTYRTATCDCCHNFNGYMEGLGATIIDNIVEQATLDSIKAQLGLSEDNYACHTAKINDYFVEGHVPAFAILKLLTEKPSIDGIGIPDMPAGVAGMSGSKISEVVIYSFVSGESEIYTTF